MEIMQCFRPSGKKQCEHDALRDKDLALVVSVCRSLNVLIVARRSRTH